MARNTVACINHSNVQSATSSNGLGESFPICAVRLYGGSASSSRNSACRICRLVKRKTHRCALVNQALDNCRANPSASSDHNR